MATTRQLCRLLRAHLCIDPLPHAARLVRDFARERAQAMRNPGLEGVLARKGIWDDMGALKTWLRDDLASERNRYAREVMKDVERGR